MRDDVCLTIVWFGWGQFPILMGDLLNIILVLMTPIAILMIFMLRNKVSKRNRR